MMSMKSWTQNLALAALLAEVRGQGVGHVDQCPGTTQVQGHGTVSVIAAKVNMKDFAAGPVRNNNNGVLQPEMWGRAYFGDQCTDGSYNNEQYSGLALLGKRFVYTTELSEAGCGCNAALYLVSMKQNSQVSECEDYYCDANSVCGVRCDEIDIQEANKFAFHTALHRYDDGNGLATGLGGWVRNNHFEMTAEQYGPGGRCIDTAHPFQVAVSFPVNSQGKLARMDMRLSQDGKPCQVSWSMDNYAGDPGLEHLTQSLAAGMTPVVSYWKSANMLWLDGPGAGGGPCQQDDTHCGTSGPSFYDFKIEDLASASSFFP